MNAYEIALTPHEVEELINFGVHGIVAAGSTISHKTAHSLRDKGLARNFKGGYTLTITGQIWFDVLRIGKR